MWQRLRKHWTRVNFARYATCKKTSEKEKEREKRNLGHFFRTRSSTCTRRRRDKRRIVNRKYSQQTNGNAGFYLGFGRYRNRIGLPQSRDFDSTSRRNHLVIHRILDPSIVCGPPCLISHHFQRLWTVDCGLRNLRIKRGMIEGSKLNRYCQLVTLVTWFFSARILVLVQMTQGILLKSSAIEVANW